MTDKTISFADAARARRQHYPAAGAGDADIVEAVHRIDVLTQLYLSTIRETVLPLNEQLPITSPVADYEHFAQVLHGLVALKLARPLLRTIGHDPNADQGA
jgi:hypothetical protein